MKIGLDLRMVGGGSGIDRYISCLSHEILEKDKTNEYVLFFRDADQAEAYDKYNHKIVITHIPHYSMAEQIKLPRILNRENLDLVHFPHFNVPLLYDRPFIVTIHDLIHTKIPGRKKSHIFHRIGYNLIIRRAVRASRQIIAVSQSTKNEIIEFFRIKGDKIKVVYEGAKTIYQMIDKLKAKDYVLQHFGIADDYILYVGVWRRYKNLPKLVNAFDRLKNQGIKHKLVLVGNPDPHYPEILAQVSRTEFPNSVIQLGRVSDPDLLYLYNAAELFVLPSLSEGFGLTPLEAGACGVAVACSDIPTLREVMGSGAEYFDPNNVANMADVIKGILDNDKRREELANLALSRTKHFSWRAAAVETINQYTN